MTLRLGSKTFVTAPGGIEAATKATQDHARLQRIAGRGYEAVNWDGLTAAHPGFWAHNFRARITAPATGSSTNPTGPGLTPRTPAAVA